MIRLRHFLLLSLLPFAACGCARSAGETLPTLDKTLTNPNDAKAAAKAANGFGLRLLQATAKRQPGENVFLSPTSLGQALSLACAGSEKETQAQMAQVLGLPADREQAGRRQAALALALSGSEDVTLQTANAIWSDAKFPFRDTFIGHAGTYYGARAASLDFQSPGAADTINGWVADATRGKITELVDAGAIQSASAVLTNAVYFKGQWQDVFEKSATQTLPFTPETGAAYSIPLMHRTDSYGFYAGDKWDMARLPYGKGRWGLIAVLPHKGTSLASVLGSLNAAQWANAVGKLQTERVALAVPRFKLTYSASMKPALTTLGMSRPFENVAEFEPMFQRERHKIDDVLHKTVLEVNEEGAEAAAATAVIMATGAAAPGQPRSFVLDRPFLCFIVDSETGAIVFAGVVYRPEAL